MLVGSFIFPYLERSKVNNTVDLWVLLEGPVERFLICDIQLLEFRPLSRYQFNAINDFCRRIVQIVGYDHLVVGFKQRKSCERSNVAGTTIRSDIVSTLSATGIVNHVQSAYPVIKQVPTTMLQVSVKGSFASLRGNVGDVQVDTRGSVPQRQWKLSKIQRLQTQDIKIKTEPIDGCLDSIFTARFKTAYGRINEIPRAAPSRKYSQSVHRVRSTSPLGYDVHAEKAFLFSATLRRRLPEWAVPLPTA